MATEAQRAHLHVLMTRLVAYEHAVHYPPHDIRGPADARTFHLSEQELEHVLRAGGGVTMDCSEAVTELCKWAGLRDPNGLAYRYAGYTGTLLAHLPHFSDPADAYTGGLVVYGPGTGDHVSMVYDRGRDPLLWSHGREGGPELIHLSQQRVRHRAPVTFLSVAHL